MKKLFFIAAIAGAALVSCTKNELAPSATEQHEITFASPVASTVTKTPLIPSDYPTTESFSVYADYHKDEYALTNADDFTSYMRGSEGVAVTHKTSPILNNSFNSYWSAATKYYWPMDGHLTFAAYSPTEVNGFAEISYDIVNGVQITGFEINTKTQYDLMLSDRTVNQKKGDMGIDKGRNPANDADNDGVSDLEYDGVMIKFNHVLSAIKFGVQTAADYKTTDGYTITLQSLTVKNAYSKGNLKQFVNKDATTVELSKVWSNVGTPNEKGYTITNTPVELNTTIKTFTDPAHADWVMLPQVLDHGDNDVEVEITYSVSHKDMGVKEENGQPVYNNGQPVYNSITYTKSLSLAGTGTTADGSDEGDDPDAITVNSWLAGNRYIYTIIIGMEEIVFAPTVVAPWTDVNVNVPESSI